MKPLLNSRIFPAVINPVTEADKIRAFISELYQDPVYQYASISLPLQAIDPLACLEMTWKEQHFHYYWENPSEDFAIAAGQELLEVTASGENRFRDIRQQIEAVRSSAAEYSLLEHSYDGMLFLGGFSFFDEAGDNVWSSFPSASFTVPKWAIIKEGKYNLLSITIDLDLFNSAGKAHAHLLKNIERIKDLITVHSNHEINTKDSGSLERETIAVPHAEYNRWISAVNRAKKHISADTYKKIVLARQVSVPNPQNTAPTHLINILRREYSNCYNFLIHRSDNTTFLGSTPERLASFRNNLLLTEALAGSMERGQTAADDTYLERQLSLSPKNKKEHDFVINDIELRLKTLVKEFHRADQPEIKKLANVQHLYTSVRAKLKDNVNPLSIIEALHPTPAVGGYPREKATPYIRKLENFNRGWYAGPVGWLNNKGRGEFAVGIRSGLLTESTAHFFAGCGIVADSDAAAEWNETNLKLKPMLSALQYD